MKILRDFERTEGDDFKLRVAPYISEGDGAVALYDEDGNIVGWKIKPIYE